MGKDWKIVTAEHITEAIVKYREDNMEETDPAGYYVVYEGEKYPSKFIRALAYALAIGSNDIDMSGCKAGSATGNYLKNLGFTVEGPATDGTSAVKELPIEIRNKFIHGTDLEPDRYDACYELMRETVRAYAGMDDFSNIDYNDLNLVYFNVVGTWKMKIAKRQQLINESHLPDEEKKRLQSLLIRNWNRVLSGQYQHKDAGNLCMGLFGTGFFSFKSMTDQYSSQQMIRLLISLLPMNDDNAMFDLCEPVLKSPIKGMKTASLSAILHCLKPFTFPILNGNAGSESVFKQLGLVEKSGDIKYYIENCRRIKQYRDENFTVKNYRNYDLVSTGLDDDDFFPTLTEYNPGLSCEDYDEVLSLYSENQGDLDTVLRLYMMGGSASCKQIADTYGKETSHYIRNATTLAQKVLHEKDCPLWTSEDGTQAYWAILFQGKYEGDSFIWKMREPLRQAIQEMLEEGIISMPIQSNFSKNMILYGPPGTGKTYMTAIYAVAICTGRSVEEVKQESYADVMEQYRYLMQKKRICFTTFHQSYGYEEFIEGIKPVVDEEQKSLGYTIEGGIFKKFCENARILPSVSEDPSFSFDASIWFSMLDQDRAKENKKYCFEHDVLRYQHSGTGSDVWFRERFCNGMQIGDYVLSYAGGAVLIDAIGKIIGDPEMEETSDAIVWTRKVQWYRFENPIDVQAINSNKLLPKFEIARINHMALSDLLALIPGRNLDNVEKKLPYVFIIDEINRGNISKIFGELITLIEESKREGSVEMVPAILPYSKSTFSVPENVYIIGTMNTADRSIAMMDTALRRRFYFVEMLPEPKALKDMGIPMVEGLDLSEILRVMNERITYLYDREHTIGHAFFRKLADSPDVKTLGEIFRKSVIPLLQEYFYEDYYKIQLVLGDNAKSKELRFIIDEDLNMKQVFRGNVDDIDLADKKYRINEKAFENIESYKQII